MCILLTISIMPPFTDRSRLRFTVLLLLKNSLHFHIHTQYHKPFNGGRWAHPQYMYNNSYTPTTTTISFLFHIFLIFSPSSYLMKISIHYIVYFSSFTPSTIHSNLMNTGLSILCYLFKWLQYRLMIHLLSSSSHCLYLRLLLMIGVAVSLT